jgi:hypothetical protein
MLAENCLPSPWRVQKTASLLLLIAIIGAPTLHAFLNAGPRLHRRLANTKRKRKPQIAYPMKRLF